MEQRFAEKITDFTRKTGATFVGEFNIDLKIPISVEEKCELGERQSALLMECQRLENELREYSKQKRVQIDDVYSSAITIAGFLESGHRSINRPLHCFYDHNEKKRLYVDIETGEILTCREPRPGDEQVRLDSIF